MPSWRACAALLCTATCALLVSNALAASVNCNTQASLTQESGVYPFVVGSNFATPVACSLTGGNLQITSTANTETSSAGYLTKLFRIVNGFRATFTFQVSGSSSASGFAFVVQKTSTQIVGGASANLGYNFANSLAVEFDMFTDSTIPDTAGGNHVELHTTYTDVNSARNDVARLATASADPGVNMKDGNAHNVVINYIPASSVSGATGQFTMQIDSGPVLSTYVNSDTVASMFPNGIAYIGFTGSTSASVAANVLISNFAFYTVQVDPTQSYIVNNALSSGQVAYNAKTTEQARLQLVDKCGTALPISYGNQITVAVTLDGTTASSNGGSAVTDLATGQYSLFWWNSVAAIPSTSLQLVVKFAGNNIKGSPFAVTVVPGVPNGPTSSISPSIPTTFTAGVTVPITVTLKDFLGNPTPLPSGFWVNAGFQSAYDTIGQYSTAVSGQPSNIVVSLVSNTAQTGVSVLVRVHNPSISPDKDVVSPVTVSVSAGGPSGSKSGLDGLGLTGATAGQSASLTLTVNDANSNPVNTNSGVTVVGTLTWSRAAGQIPPSTTPSPISLTVTYNSANKWTLSYSTNVAGYYTLSVTVNGVATSNSGAPYVQPAVVSRGDILTAIPTGTAASSTFMQIQPYDSFNNARSSVNAAGQDFQVTVTTSGYTSSTIGCTSQAAPSSNAYVSVFACTFLASGVYQVEIAPLKAQTYTMSLSVQGGSASTLTNKQFSVVPANPAAAQSSVQSLPATSVAGVSSTFQLTIRDANQNVRTGVDDRSYISLATLAPSSGAAATITSVVPDNNGNYLYSYYCGVAGTYSVTVKVSGTTVPASTTSTSCVPGAFQPSGSILNGQGLNGGVGGAAATFTLQARDRFGNNLLLPSNTQNSVRAQITDYTGAKTAGTCNGDATTGGLYTCSYTVPAYASANPTFNLTVYGTPQGGGESMAATYIGSIAKNLLNSNAKASGTNLRNAVAGAASTFIITDYDQQATPQPSVVPDSTIFGVNFIPNFANPPASTISQPSFTCTDGTTTCNPRTVGYTAYIAGTYTVRVFAEGQETVESKATNFQLTVVAGAIYPAATVLTAVNGTTSVAGQNFAFTASVADMYGNTIKVGGATITFATSTEYSAPVVVDNKDGTYTISTTFYAAGPARRIVPLLNGVSTSGLTVAVAAGSINGGKSYIDTLPSSIVAGVATPIQVTLLDAWNNPIANMPASTCSMSLTNNPGLQQSFPTSTSNSYTLTFTPLYGNYSMAYTAAVSCLGITITNPAASQPVTILPASIDGTKSSVNGLATQTYVAGNMATFNLYVRDVYGNPFSTTGSITVEFAANIAYNAARSFAGAQALVAADGNRPGQGAYIVTFTPKYSSPGNYTFLFKLDGTPFTPAIGVVPVFVNPGTPVLAQSLLPIGGLPNDISKNNVIKAGDTYSLQIKLRDVYQNPIVTGGLASQLQVFFYSKYQSTYCRQGRKDTSAPSGNFTSAANKVTDNGDGSYTISLQTTVSGAYWFDVAFQGQTLIVDSNCVSIPDMTGFTVVPLDASAPNTQLSQIFNGRAGDIMSFNVTMYDKYNNLVLNNNHNISTGSASLCSATPGNLPALTLANTGGVVTGPFGPTFTVTFQVNTSSNYVVPVLLDGVLASGTVGVCPTVFVRPAYISSVNFASSGNITAGLFATLTLQSSDRFGNPVYSGGSTATIPVFTATFSRTAGALYEVTNTSVYTGPASYSLVPITFDVDGPMAVSVVLPADPLDPTSFTQTFTTSITVLPAACSTVDPTTPFRCPSNRQCVANYNACPGFSPCNGVICPGTTTCVNYFSQCNTTTICTNGTVFCATGVNVGYCALPQVPAVGTNVSAPACPLGTQDNFCLYQGLVNCGNGLCRASLADCPSKKVCPPFTQVCPDGSSCAANSNNCPPLPTIACAPPMPFQCRDGRCVSRAENCGAEVTCQNGNVLCPDGSCQTSADQCRETFGCLFSQIKCPNGECRTRLQDCPTTKTCNPGQVLCENGACRDTVALCDAVSTVCLNGVRCADGTCRPNQFQCPTLSTCPAAFPVRCADQSCVRDVAQCKTGRVCPASASYLCPDGSCVQFATSCPSTISCPVNTPTMCPDGSCVDVIDSCAQTRPETCPPFRPYRCTDGSCVGDWNYCPTKQVKCFDYAPVLCPDRRCVSSVEMCATAASAPCAAGTIRCPNGGCAWSRALCPTQISCGAGFIRGTDGSCHVEVSLSGNATTSFSVGASPNCPRNQVICPQSHQGYTCANSLADCPQDVTCPRDRPVRCSDASCAMSYEDCYPVVPVSGTTVVCPGAATASSGSCGASTTCPDYAPTKCWDESCRVLPEDCPPQAKCDPSNNYLCSNGQCTSSPLSCTSGQKCNVNGATVKCPWAPAGISQCVRNVTQCANLFKDMPSRTCPDSYSRCRDGYCSLDQSRCNALSCPASIPYICPDGLCARNMGECNVANGCPFDATYKCTDGSCVASATACPTVADCPDSKFPRCADGSCPDAAHPCKTNSTGCDDGAQLCFDRQCSQIPSGCSDSTDSFNACPAYRPYRCADGFCAMSSYLCPVIPLPISITVPITTSTGLVKSVRCADGTMVAFGMQCPVIRPCPSTQVRCPNGQCRDTALLCPAANPCAILFPASDLGPAGVRCPSGHCASSLGACIDETIGCSGVASYKCPDGLCVIGPSQCAPALPLLAQPANGCPSSTPYKCFDGSCSADVTTCPAANGCPAATPFLCADGTCLATATCAAATSGASTACASGVRCPNGQCQSAFNQCSMPNGCGVSTPVRCADGTCKKFPAHPGNGPEQSDSCQATIVCDAAAPFKCADNTCVSNSRFCRAVNPCPITAPILCPGFVCQTLANSTCPTSSSNICPSQSPILCPDGACSTSVSQCSAQTGVVCAAGQIRCFDGSCKPKGLDCAQIAFNVYQNGNTFSPTADHGNTTCPIAGSTLCADGSCVTSSNLCPLVPSCPTTLPLRCPNGACINVTTTSCDAIGDCSTPNKRCEDGTCRAQCLPFNGCPVSAPYHCFGRKVRCTKDQATCVSGSSFAHRRRLLQMSSSSGTSDPNASSTGSSDPSAASSTGGSSPTPTPTPTPSSGITASQEACVNCESNIAAIAQTIQLSSGADQVIDVSVNAAAVPRTQLVIPAGTFGGAVSQITIHPVSSDGLSFPTSPTSQSSMAAGPFYFSTNVLSTPFRIELDNPSATFLGSLTVQAAIDNMVYDPYAPSGTVVQQTVPCEIQGPTFTVAPDPTIYTASSNLKYNCNGQLSLSTTGMSFNMDPTCESINIAGVYTGQGGSVTQQWDGTSSASCDCFNITSSIPGLPGVLPPYPPKNTSQPWTRYDSTYPVCFYITRTQSQYTMAMYTDPSRASVACPFRGKEPNALFYTMARDAGDGCGGQGVGGNRVMNPQDICLATVDPLLNTWSCLQPARADRLANPTWSTAAGRPQNRVAGRVATASNSVLAFAYIPIPAEPVVEPPTCNVWCQYKWVIIGVIIGFGAFVLIMAYVISRFKRYRDKYREQKENLAQLKDYAREIDENRGGLGVADEDVDMMANPMVIQMQELDKQLAKVNLEMDTQKEKDTRVIDQLSQDRERLHAEIERVKKLMAQQQKTTATRLEDVHVSQAHVAIPVSAPAPVSSTSGLIPMEMEGPSDADASSSGAGQERHGFAQIRRPAKKKDDF